MIKIYLYIVLTINLDNNLELKDLLIILRLYIIQLTIYNLIRLDKY